MSTVVTEQGDQIEIIIYDGGVEFQGAGGVNGIISGTTAPAANLGNEGDYYINTVLNVIYGPKTNGIWGAPTNIKGEKGQQGVQGEPGQTGAPGEKGDDANITDISIDADKRLVLSVDGSPVITYDISPFVKVMVGDVEILKKGASKTNLKAIETGDIILFYDANNGKARVEGEVKNEAVDYDDYNSTTKKYSNLKIYSLTKPSL